MRFTRRDECCDKCVMAFGNDMTYEQRGLVLLVHTHGAAFLLAEECVSTAELPVTEFLQTFICSDVFVHCPLRPLLAGRTKKPV